MIRVVRLRYSIQFQFCISNTFLVSLCSKYNGTNIIQIRKILLLSHRCTFNVKIKIVTHLNCKTVCHQTWSICFFLTPAPSLELFPLVLVSLLFGHCEASSTAKPSWGRERNLCAHILAAQCQIRI